VFARSGSRSVSGHHPDHKNDEKRLDAADFPTRFPTELLTTGWKMVTQSAQRLGKKALFFKTKRDWTLQDKMGGKGLGNRCSIQLSYGTKREFRRRFLWVLVSVR
jgi:hypothetical protein